MENEPNKNDNKWWGYFIVAVFILWIVAYFKKLGLLISPTKYYPKSDLVDLYRVDIKTINKWVETFCNPAILPYDIYKKKRKLPEGMYNYIIECLGEPTVDMPVLTKLQIVTNNDSDGIYGNEYRGVRNSIRLDPEAMGISPDVYAMFNVFPPKIASHISKKLA
jgi:hypothetical protein